jgi:RNA polymerase sigma-70 factor (ECF subfamily)
LQRNRLVPVRVLLYSFVRQLKQGKPLSDEIRHLVDRCLTGNEAAMADFVDRFKGRVFGLCWRMLGQRQDAEDMAQETFVRALKNLHRWDPMRQMEPWLLAIAGNRCRSLLSTRMRRPAPAPLISEVADERPDQTGADNLAEEVRLALLQLRPEYRQAFVLFHEQELSYAEIAEAMDCPLGTVKTWIHRGRSELIERLRDRGVLEESRNAVREI